MAMGYTLNKRFSQEYHESYLAQIAGLLTLLPNASESSLDSPAESQVPMRLIPRAGSGSLQYYLQGKVVCCLFSRPLPPPLAGPG